MAEPQQPARAWWQTLPGALSALAAVITAVTGLIVAVSQLRGHSSEPAAAVATEIATGGAATGTGTATGTIAAPGGAAAARVSFPHGTTATIRELVYDVVDARAVRRNPGELALVLRVKLTDRGDYGANFWDRTFRLRVGSDARAPIDFLDEIVEAGTSGEGTVTFALPSATRSATLLVGDPGGPVVELPLALRS